MSIAVQMVETPVLAALAEPGIIDAARAEVVLVNHLERCRVMGIVTVKPGRQYGTEMLMLGELVNDNLDDPDTQPWFLIRGKHHTIDRYLIANEKDEYYPVESFGSQNDPNIKCPRYFLMPKDNHQQPIGRGTGTGGSMYDWSMFSEIDRQLVTEAITTFLRNEFT